jgi:D-glycero-alpha-D-manno-heptose-7-phosphate kinase
MIITRTPFRISFAGGGSDFKEYYQEDIGAVVSATIDKYIFLSMHPLFHKTGYFLKYSHNEIVEDVDLIQHPIIRNIFTKHNIMGVDFNSSSDVPAGTGLGSSSSFTVGLLNLCTTYNNQFCSEALLAEQACKVEIEELQSPIGKQDQYAAAFGGLNFIKFNADESVTVKKLHMKLNDYTQFEKTLLLLYLGYQRVAGEILTEQKRNVEQNRPTLRKMVQLAYDLQVELLSGNLRNIGEILTAGWLYKKELASTITNSTIDEALDAAKNHGALGGKLLGAGSTGFLLLVVPNDRRQEVKHALGLYELPFRFDNSGTTVIYS